MADNDQQTPEPSIADLIAKRRYARHDKACPMRYRLLDLGEMPYRARTVNVSGGGACLLSDFEIGKGKTVALEIELSKKQLLAIGTVMWSEKTEDGQYQSGVKFLLLKELEEEELGAGSLDGIVNALENKGITASRQAY